MACNCDSALSLRCDAGTPIVLGWVRHGILSRIVSSAISLTPSCENKVPTNAVYQSNEALVIQ
jgi:hypothetical protein